MLLQCTNFVYLTMKLNDNYPNTDLLQSLSWMSTAVLIPEAFKIIFEKGFKISSQEVLSKITIYDSETIGKFRHCYSDLSEGEITHILKKLSSLKISNIFINLDINYLLSDYEKAK